MLNSLIISQDYLSAGKSLIGLFLALLFSLISSGYFLEENRGKSLTKLLINALSAEKSESTDLISSMVRPKGAKKIIDILHKLAAIDDDVAKEEIDLINDFAQKWRIEIPELKLTAVCTEVPAFVFIIIPSFASKNVVPRLSPLPSLRTYKVPI